MLTIAEVSGIIAAAVMIVQYTLPAALVIILVKLVGTENTAATWSAINRTISNTVWPMLLQADAVASRHHSLSTVAVSWTMTLGAVLLVVAGVVTPLGLRDEIVPGTTQPVDFQYARDLSAWGPITPVRPDLKYGRHCEFGRRINCPGQFQGVDFVETSPGILQSVKRDNSSTVNTTIPANYTEMFASATGDPGNTISGMFDVQYRRWKVNYEDIIDHGEPQAQGDYRYIELLIPQDDIILKEGLVIDLRDNPGIGFRNHTVPVGLAYGGTWSEDLLWLEPVTSCADTNLSVEIQITDTPDSFTNNVTIFFVDRGAFRDLDLTALEAPPWGDNQTLDLFGRAHTAARMYNALAALSFLNLTLPLDPSVQTIPKIDVKNSTFNFSSDIEYSYINSDIVELGDYVALEDTFYGGPYNVSVPDNFVSRYPNGIRKLFASNLTSIGNICKGFYAVDSTIDRRASNITNPMVECGLLFAAGRPPGATGNDSTATPLADVAAGLEIKRRDLFSCATAIRASIKTVYFRYNGTEGQLSNLRVDRIEDKAYPDEGSKPLWAVESSWPERMTFDPLWGMVNSSYETTPGFSTMRSAKLWLPTVVSPGVTFGTRNAFDMLAAVTAPGLNVANLYTVLSDTNDHTGKQSYPLVERFGRLSADQAAAGQIPSLLLTDILASLLVGTKTAIHTAPVAYPARLAVADPPRGLSRASVVAFRRVIRYDMRYAAPAVVVLALLLAVAAWAAGVLLVLRTEAVRRLRDMYNQTSTGRLATALLCPDRPDSDGSSPRWVHGGGKLVLQFGRIGSRKEDYFLRLSGRDVDSKPSSQLEEGAHLTTETKGGVSSVTVPI